MLSDDEFSAWAEKQNIPATGIEYIRRVRLNPPQRTVEGRVFTNVTSFYPSRKMERTIQTESHTGERPFVLYLEYDDENIFEYWDQPASIPVERTNKKNKRFRSHYTADYLAIERQGAVVYEIKPLRQLMDLVASYPEDWVRAGEEYRFIPAQREFEQIGICHKVICSANLNLFRAENIQLLLQARDKEDPIKLFKLSARAKRLLKKECTLSIAQLQKAMGLSDATPILNLIDRKLLFTSLDAERLSMVESAMVALDEEMYVLAGRGRALMMSGTSAPVSMDQVPNSREQVRIIHRRDALCGRAVKKKSERTLRRYRAKLKGQEENLLALVSGYGRCGRKCMLLHSAHEELIQEVIKDHFAAPGHATQAASFRHYLYKFSERKAKGDEGFLGSPVVIATFKKRIEKKNVPAIEAARGGRRAGLAILPPTAPDSRALRPTRAFQIAHMDHYLADIYVVVIRTSKKIFATRPWVTILVDGYADAVIAIALSLAHPSRMSCSRVLRDCVRRNGRLPEAIMTDSGAEFRSTFYHSFLAAACIEKFQRPVSAGRWGREVERAFGVYKETFFAAHPGNTRLGLRSRSLSSGFQPHEIAEVELIDCFHRIDHFTFNWLNCHPRGTSTVAPSLLIEESLQTFPCSGLLTTYDQAFEITTAVPIDKAKFDIDIARGIRYRGRHYFDPEFIATKKMSITDVRQDSEESNLVYAAIGDKWHLCKSGNWSNTLGVDSLINRCESLKWQEGRQAIKEAKAFRDAELARTVYLESAPIPAPQKAKASVRPQKKSKPEGIVPIAMSPGD